MLMLLVISTILLSLQAIIALTVVAKGLNSRRNITFALLSLSLLLWELFSYVFEEFSWAQNIAVVRFTMLFVVMQNTFFMYFSMALSNRKLSPKKLNLYNLLSLLTATVSVSPFLFTELASGPRGLYPLAGPGMLFFIIHAIISIKTGFKDLLISIKKSIGLEKTQIRFIFAGSLVLWGLVPLTNFLYSVILKTTFFGRFSPIYGFIFSSLIAYAIVKLRLFDIRAVVARAVVYFFVTFFVAVFHVVFVNAISGVAIKDVNYSPAQLATNITVTVLLILIYPKIQVGLNRLTKKIFYRDSYDPQVFIDELNKTFVSNVDTEELLKKSCDIIEENIKSELVSFYVRDTSYFEGRLVGDYEKKLNHKDTSELHSLLPKLHKKVIYTEQDISVASEVEKQVISLMKNMGIEVLVRIVSTLDYEVDGVGYLLLGQKKSGNPYSKQDIKMLEIISNELVIAVENALRYEEIEQFNVTLQKKIDNATKELQRSNDKLKALDEAKDEFVSMASHQLRTPLTSIKGYISMVLEGDAGKLTDTQDKMLKQAMFSSQRMVYLISDLLNVSRLRTGKFIIESSPVYLPDLVETEMTQLHEGASAKNLTISYEKPKKFPTLNLDDMKIRQVVMNFTDNAIYYTPSGGKIAVALKDKKDSVEFTVKDTGIGVPKAEQHKLFAKFYRAGNAQKARPDGTGLGLFMAKKVVIAQGGSLIFSSKEGKGSTFGFSFPKEKLEVSPQEKQPENTKA